MAHNKGKGPPSSAVISIVDYDDDDERHNLWDGSSGWQTSADNKALRRYITDLDPGGVTTGVSVDNLTEGEGRNTARMAYTVGDEDIAGVVTVIIGAKCPDMSEQSKSYFEVEVTHLRSDVAVIRYLESGWWYCLDG